MTTSKLSFSQRLENCLDSKAAHCIVTALIVTNASILGLQTSDDMVQSYGPLLIQLDKVILGVFILELALKIFASRLSFFKNGWNNFDFIVIGISVLSYGTGLSILRAFRILRLLILVDVLPRMRHVVSGLVKSIRGIFNVGLLTLLIFYIFSILGVNCFDHPDIKSFNTIGHAMMALFQVITGDDWTSYLKETSEVYPHSWIYFYSFYIIVVFIIVNLFIGVVVNALQLAEEEIEKDKKIADSSNEQDVAHHIRKIRHELKEIKEILNTSHLLQKTLKD